ncbi:hypothetical protein [Beduinella massiliensis]|uniref:hypothetical protein n=1 Tax=Beduinella massiliensis TaxID=1852363 RepID=UPI000C858205
MSEMCVELNSGEMIVRLEAEETEAARKAALAAEQAARAAGDAEALTREAEVVRVEAEQRRAAAESARAVAERGREGAEAQRASAEAERDGAEEVRAAAEAGRNGAEALRKAAEQARAGAEMERDSAETARASSEDARKSAEAGRESAETARASSEDARRAAETGRERAESARASSEGTRERAETGRESAEAARASSEDARKTAEAGRESAETARASSENARKTAEDARKSAETEREQAEASRAAAEDARKGAETEREQAESKRAAAEDARKSAETKRAEAEAVRVTAEDTRKSAETGRANAEASRVAAEDARKSAETGRANAETARKTAEDARKSAETGREQAEAKRVADSAKALLDAQAAVDAADGWARAEASARTLDVGAAASASVTTAEDGHKLLTLGLPRGERGPRGRGLTAMGAWTAGVQYLCSDDVQHFVLYEDSSYVCRQSHTSGAESAPPAAAYWTLLASKGSVDNLPGMRGATADTAGEAGLVPAPAAGAQGRYLRGDGTWQTPPNTTYSTATASADGLMAKGDKAKLDGVAANANNYAHPTSAGSKHIPAGGASGQILRWGADGTATWGADNNTTYSDMKGATAEDAGKSGLVPAPAAGTQGRYLRGDGTWQTPPNTTYSPATASADGLMAKGDKAKLDGVAANANNYAHPTSAGSKHIPAGGANGQILRWSADGTAAWGADNNTTYSDMKGATAEAAGANGLVPAPAAGTQGKYLRGDGTWQTPPNTTYGVATASADGLMAKGDKAKLDGVATNANNYAHPTNAGNKHIPAGGASGQILRWSADGTAAWGADNDTTYGLATGSADGLMSSADKKKLDGFGDADSYLDHPVVFSLPVSAWTGSGPYSAVISDARFAEDTKIDSTDLSADTLNHLPHAAIDYETTDGKITLTTEIKPSITLAGTFWIRRVAQA